MSSGARIKAGRYTDADVLAIYMKHRESGIGPFVREVGDFIAHSKRDRGATLDTTAYMFAQVAFFQTYQGTNKQPLEPTGKCGWWLRHYFLSKVKDATEADLGKACGLTKKQAKNAIKSWFPDKLVYPTEIRCNDPSLLYRLASHFSQMLVGKNVFDLAQAKLELLKIFDAEGINHEELDRFIVGTATLLIGKSVEIVPGFIASIKVNVGTRRNVKIDHPDNTDDMWYSVTLPDGDLKIMVSTDNKTGDGLVSVALDFLDTGIDTETYFCRSLVELDEYKMAQLRLDRTLSFDTSQERPVTGL